MHLGCVWLKFVKLPFAISSSLYGFILVVDLLVTFNELMGLGGGFRTLILGGLY